MQIGNIFVLNIPVSFALTLDGIFQFVVNGIRNDNPPDRVELFKRRHQTFFIARGEFVPLDEKFVACVFEIAYVVHGYVEEPREFFDIRDFETAGFSVSVV